MTRFTVVSILPEIVDGALAVGVVGRARAAGGLPLAFINPRDFTHDRHRSVDDTPYGGGPGMVMRCEPLAAAIDAAGPGHRVFLGPGGAPLTQATVRRLATLDHVVLVCGRYEGVDQRVLDACIDEEISLGDFVLTGGEPAATSSGAARGARASPTFTDDDLNALRTAIPHPLDQAQSQRLNDLIAMVADGLMRFSASETWLVIVPARFGQAIP